MKIIILAILLSAFIGGDSPHYDDEDGCREPWSEWKESSCISEPVITMDSSYNDPPCNPYTGKGLTEWACLTGGSIPLHEWISFYTAHWYCDDVIGEALQIHSTFLPLIIK